MRQDRGFTLVETMIVVAIIGLLAAMTVPGLLRAQMSGNEASAIASMRTINSAESSYASSCGAGGYAQSLDDLAKAPAGSNSGFVSPDLATNGVLKSGYIINVGPGTVASVTLAAAATCNSSSSPSIASYFAEAHPATVGTTGHRSFGADKRGTIFQDTTGAVFTAASVGAATSAVQ